MKLMIASDLHGSGYYTKKLMDAFQAEGAEKLLLLGDLLARTAISPVILPIGAITSFLGGPLFLYLLFKGGRGNAER